MWIIWLCCVAALLCQKIKHCLIPTLSSILIIWHQIQTFQSGRSCSTVALRIYCGAYEYSRNDSYEFILAAFFSLHKYLSQCDLSEVGQLHTVMVRMRHCCHFNGTTPCQQHEQGNILRALFCYPGVVIILSCIACPSIIYNAILDEDWRLGQTAVPKVDSELDKLQSLIFAIIISDWNITICGVML